MISWSVSQRTREIGIRVALGADPRGVALAVLGQGFGCVASGVLVGLAGAWVAVKLLARLLAETGTHDAAAWMASVGLLILAALLANLVPAIRAASVDPVVALRAE